MSRIGALRISGTRRIQRLVELVGPPPARLPAAAWPRCWGRASAWQVWLRSRRTVAIRRPSVTKTTRSGQAL